MAIDSALHMGAHEALGYASLSNGFAEYKQGWTTLTAGGRQASLDSKMQYN